MISDSDQANGPASIAERAYDRWLQRRQAGHLDDWLAAEAEIVEQRALARRVSELERLLRAATRTPVGQQLAEAEAQLIASSAELNRAESRMTVEHAVSRLLANAFQLAEVIVPLLQAIGGGLGWNTGALWMVDRDRQSLRCVDCWHAATSDACDLDQFGQQRRVAPGVGLLGRLWADGAPMWVSDVAHDPDTFRPVHGPGNVVHGWVGLPIRIEGEILGVMEFFSREPRQLDEAQFETMRAMARGISEFVARRQDTELLQQHFQESRVARQIQEGLLPTFVPANSTGYSIAGRSSPSSALGGDYFDFFPLMDHCLAVSIGDASGHGVGAALMIAETRAYLRAHALTTTDLNTILTRTNRCLVADLTAGRFVTLLLVCFDAAGPSMTFTGAGHCPGYVIDRTGRIKATLAGDGCPLGIDATGTYPPGPAIPLAPGDVIFLYTDGIVEAGLSGAAGLFGIERALTIVQQHRDETPEEILEALFRAVHEFSGPEGQVDDATAVVIKVQMPAGLQWTGFRPEIPDVVSQARQQVCKQGE